MVGVIGAGRTDSLPANTKGARMITRRIGNLIAASAAVAGAMVLIPQSADAVGGSCTSSRQEKEQTGPNAYRVRAKCSSLQGDSKAQGVLDKAGVSDPETPWFTALNTYYYSNYVSCIWPNTCDNTRVKIEHV